MTFSETVLDIASSQVGEQEEPIGSNWGPVVQAYLASVGITFPAPWCMAFVYWCFNEAAKMMSVANPVYKTGGVMMQLAKSKSKIVKKPQPGDVFIMEFGHGLGHTGIVESINGNVVNTIEGNTNDDGSREGYEVARRTRKISSIAAFLRW